MSQNSVTATLLLLARLRHDHIYIGYFAINFLIAIKKFIAINVFRVNRCVNCD